MREGEQSDKQAAGGGGPSRVPVLLQRRVEAKQGLQVHRRCLRFDIDGLEKLGCDLFMPVAALLSSHKLCHCLDQRNRDWSALSTINGKATVYDFHSTGSDMNKPA